MDCYVTVTLCDNEYTLSKDGEVTINVSKTAYCAYFPTIPIVVLAQTIFPSFKRDKYTTQGGIINPYATNGRVDVAVGLSITKSGGSPMSVNATLQGGTITVTSRQDLMPKLAEWHIYGNEQQGRFVFHPLLNFCK